MSEDALQSWREEKQSAYLYRELSLLEKGTPREKLFARLGEEAESQSGIWAKKIPGNLPVYEPSIRARIVIGMAKTFGPKHIRSALAAMKVRGISVYSTGPHPSHESAADIGKRHRSSGSAGNLRAAIFGMNDGLVSNAALIIGVAGATSDPQVMTLTGVAGLLAGAFSMASGEYVSVRSQREMFEYQISLEKEELEAYPEEEAKELALIYEAKGLTAADADRLAHALIADPKKALDTLAREELGLNPDELGSPWGAALYSFLSFAFGALIPLAPFVLHLNSAMTVTLIISGISLFAIGAALSLFTGRSALWGGLRMFFIGAGAGVITHFIGGWLGVRID